MGLGTALPPLSDVERAGVLHELDVIEVDYGRVLTGSAEPAT